MDKWPTDKQLEDFYREKFESHPFPYQEDAWEEMEVLLDRQNRRRWLFIILFFGLVGALWVYSSNNFSFKSIHNSKETIALDKDVTSSTESNKSSDAMIKDLAQLSSGATENTNVEYLNKKNSQPIISQPKAKGEGTSTSGFARSQDLAGGPSTIPNANQEYLRSVSSDLKDVGSEPYAVGDTENVIKYTSSDVYKVSQLVGDHAVARTEREVVAGAIDTYKKATQDLWLEQLGIHPFTIAYDLPELPDWDSSNLTGEMDKQNNWRFGLGVSSSSSWTEHGDYSKIDMGFHALGTYFINDRVGIQVNASYINDIYRAEQADYKADDAFWKLQGAPDYISADCEILGLAVGLEYYLKGRNVNGLVLEASTASSFVLKESYNYHYPLPENNFASSWANSDNQWFNGLNFGLSHQWYLENKMALQIGPFYELPLAGLGHGEVRLSKIGLQMNVSF